MLNPACPAVACGIVSSLKRIVKAGMQFPSYSMSVLSLRIAARQIKFGAELFQI